MKIHSLDGMKTRARNEWLQLGEQRMHGASVISEGVPVTALLDGDVFTWIVGGRFASEDEAGEFLLDLPPGAADPTQTAFARFDAFRAEQMQALDLGNPEYAALAHLSESWTQLYRGSEGFLRIVDLSGRSNNVLPLDVLSQKQDIAEKGLLDISQRFTTEFKRLELVPVMG